MKYQSFYSILCSIDMPGRKVTLPLSIYSTTYTYLGYVSTSEILWMLFPFTQTIFLCLSLLLLVKVVLFRMVLEWLLTLVTRSYHFNIFFLTVGSQWTCLLSDSVSHGHFCKRCLGCFCSLSFLILEFVSVQKNLEGQCKQQFGRWFNADVLAFLYDF